MDTNKNSKASGSMLIINGFKILYFVSKVTEKQFENGGNNNQKK